MPAVVILEPDYGAELPLTSEAEGVLGWQQTRFSPQLLDQASQINGCGFCTDMRIKDALHAGESQQRLNLVAVWRETTVFTEAERAALELAEQGTRIADAAGGVTDEAWANAAKHYDDDQLVALVAAIALINAYNRMFVIMRQPAGD